MSFQKSDQIDQLATALAAAQGAMEGAAKASNNPHFRSKYASLEYVVDAYREEFAKNKLALTQHLSAVGAEVSVTTILLHASGQWISSTLTMTAKDAGPQAIGSCCTYLRRYSALAVTGLAPLDDDAEAAEARPPQKPFTPSVGGYVQPNIGAKK